MQDELKPELRFPEFEDSWENTQLGDIAKFSKGKGISKSEIDENGALECIRYGELYTHYGEVIEEILSKTAALDGLVLSKKNDVIIPASGESQLDIAKASCVLKSGIALGGDLNIIRTKQNGVFLSYYLNSEKKLDIAKLAQGNSVVHLYSSQLSKLDLNIADLPEQTKIADFLSSVDEKIKTLTKMKTLLEEYKKGVMQRLFNREIRFKDDRGQDFPDWEEKKAGRYFKNHTNKKHRGDLPILAITQENGAVLRDSIGIDIKSSETSVKSYKIVEQGDFIISLRSFQGGIEYSNVLGICSPAYTILKPKVEISNDFFKQYFKKESFISQLSNAVIGIRDGKQISFDAFANLNLQVPSLAEQQKISLFLTLLDERITKAAQQIEIAQAFKKGLLQKMFV